YRYSCYRGSSNTSYDAAIELNGGRLNLNESRLNTDISMTAAGTISTSNAAGLELNSTISFDGAWASSNSLTLDFTGAGDISLGDGMSISFSQNLEAGSYIIFSGLSNTSSLSYDFSSIAGLDSDKYKQSWTWTNDSLQVSVTQRGDYLWDNDAEWNQQDGESVNEFVDGSNLIIANNSGQRTTVSSDTALIAGNISLSGSDDIELQGAAIESDKSISKTGSNTVELGSSMSAEEGISIEGGTIQLTETGQIQSDVSITNDASLNAGNITVSAKDTTALVSVGENGGQVLHDKLHDTHVNSAIITVSKATASPMSMMLMRNSAIDYHEDATISGGSLSDTLVRLEEDVTLMLDNTLIEADSSFTGAAGSSLIADSVTIQASEAASSLSIVSSEESLCFEVDTFGDVATSVLNSISLQLMLTEDELTALNSYLEAGSEISVLISGIASLDTDTQYDIAIMNASDPDYVGPEIGFTNIDLVDGYLRISTDAIPEPSTTTLSLLALAGFLARRRRH
ncbi:MAG: PEP-CTERM sorting domain-containing protein, partial [Akkermansia sp.]